WAVQKYLKKVVTGFLGWVVGDRKPETASTDRSLIKLVFWLCRSRLPRVLLIVLLGPFSGGLVHWGWWRSQTRDSLLSATDGHGFTLMEADCVRRVHSWRRACVGSTLDAR